MEHKCIVGRHWDLNPEEGWAFIIQYTTSKQRISNFDTIIRYQYCPICGKKNKTPKHKQSFLLTK